MAFKPQKSLGEKGLITVQLGPIALTLKCYDVSPPMINLPSSISVSSMASIAGVGAAGLEGAAVMLTVFCWKGGLTSREKFFCACAQNG